MDTSIEQYERNGLTVHIVYDDASDSPADWGNYEFHDYEAVRAMADDDDRLPAEISAKLKDGRAFWVDKYEHGGVSYTLNHEGMNDRWDTAFKHGIIEFTDEYASNADTLEGRREMARSDLETYSQWANGQVYGYQIETADHEFIDSCYGYYDTDDAMADANAIADSVRRAYTAKKAQELHK